jgi:hypothetical protein
MVEATSTRLGRVRFEDTLSTASGIDSEQQTSSKISDICAFLNNTATLTKTECFILGQGRLTFRLDSNAVNQDELKNVSLEDLESVSKDIPSLKDRLRLGLKIARMIISFGSSGWIPVDLEHSQVFVLKDRNNRPYFFHKSLSVTLARQPLGNSEPAIEAALFSLGVILLELADQQGLEKTEYWNNNCHEGKPNRFTRSCAAVEWYEALELRQSVDLTDPIKRCVKNKFGKAANLEDREFLQELFDGVVTPLEKYIVGWKSAA